MPVIKLKYFNNELEALNLKPEIFSQWIELKNKTAPDGEVYVRNIDNIPKGIIEKIYTRIPNKIKIGFEFEFMLNSNHIPDDLWEKYHIEREYYRGMFELNDFFYIIEKTDSVKNIYKELKKIQTDIHSRLLTFKKDFEEEGLHPDFTPKPIYTCEGLVFNGMHLHISFPFKNKKRFEKIKNLEPHIIAKKLEIAPTYRAVTSHHIWGAYRPSEYQFKQKNRYQPIIYTNKNTIEFRLFDYDDLFMKEGLKWLALLLYVTYNDIEVEVNIADLKLYDKLKRLPSELWKNLKGYNEIFSKYQLEHLYDEEYYDEYDEYTYERLIILPQNIEIRRS